MKRILAIAVVLSLALCVPAWAEPDRSSVGLGVSVGAAFPEGSTDKIKPSNWDGSFDWGFYVNIPLIYTFHLTPSAELYKIRMVEGAPEVNATDVALAFKFIVPAMIMDLYFGIVPGLTTVGDLTNFHIGGEVGAAFNLFSNLDLFVQVKYKILIQGDKNLRMLHTNAGILYHF
jgi:hypothetical protein